jgi:hypothetical protein
MYYYNCSVVDDCSSLTRHTFANYVVFVTLFMQFSKTENLNIKIYKWYRFYIKIEGKFGVLFFI